MIGRTISHYRILEKLGQGGMGLVYKAEDTRLRRPVALKFLPPELTRDAEAKARFVHEAQAASALDHPNIYTIHEIDETPEGQLFIAMACYEGETLKERLARGPLEPREAVGIVLQIARGLAKAHAKGIVHRDVKPANIILTQDGQVKIVDFGLATLADQTRLTVTGTMLGTAAYMSPEQARGETVDVQTDVWALGVVLYEALTGQLPFGGETLPAKIFQILNVDPPPLASRRADLPAELQHVVDRALAKRIADRYPNAAELLDDLQIVHDGFAPDESRRSALSVLSGPAARRAVRWRRTALALAGALVLATGLWLVRGRLGGGQAPAPALAVLDFRNLVVPDDPNTVAIVMGLVQVGLIESCPIRVISPEYLHDLRRRLFGAGEGPIAPDQALEVARQAGATLLLMGQLGRLQQQRNVAWRLVDVESGANLAGKNTPGEDLGRLADRLIGDVLPWIAQVSGQEATEKAVPVGELTTSSPQAYRYYVAGILERDAYRAQEAVSDLEQAVEIDTTFALASLELSRIYYTGLGAGVDYGRAEANAENAWRHRSHLNVKDRLRLEAWREQLDYRVADALETYQELHSRWPDDREILNNYHRILFHYWYSERALAVAERGRELYPDDLYFGLFYQIGLAHQGRMEEALAATRAYLARHEEEPNAWDELALRHLSLGEPDSAEVAYRHALSLDPEFLPSRQGLGFCAYSRGDPDSALAINAEILRSPKLLDSQRVEILADNAFWPGSAMYQFEAGRWRQALALVDQAHEYVGDAVSALRLEATRARFLLSLGRFAEVLAWARGLAGSEAGRLADLYGIQYRAWALVGLDSLSAAKAAVQKLHDTEGGWGGVALSEAFKLTAEIALAEDRPADALAALREMARYGLPDGGLWDLEYRGIRARALRLAGRRDEAVQAWRDLLHVYGSHALAHYELGRLYEQMKRPAAARREYTALLAAWAHADDGLPEPAEARRRLAALGAR